MITSCSACVATLLIWEFILKFLSIEFIISLRCFEWVFVNTKNVFKFYYIQTNPYSSLGWDIRTVKLYHIIQLHYKGSNSRLLIKLGDTLTIPLT